MQTQEQTHHHHSHHGCCEGERTKSRGPEVFFGFCHESGRMRMMDLPDFVDNTQTAFSNMTSRMSSMFQPFTQALQQQQPVAGPGHQHGPGHHRGRGHESCCHHDEHDCHCSCCIRCADAVE